MPHGCEVAERFAPVLAEAAGANPGARRRAGGVAQRVGVSTAGDANVTSTV